MISIIICSRTEFISEELQNNIQITIGVDYEFVVIDNSKEEYSIFEAYNIGIKRSKGEYWCFIHDDILIKTTDWGKQIQEIFSINPEFGLLGIAGGKIKTQMPSAWWDVNDNVLKIKQHHKDGSCEIWDQGFVNSDIVEVMAIDGVFMAMRRNDKVIFDERLKGFHNYDLYLSLQHRIRKNKVIVSNKIFLEHFSDGSLDRSWLKSTSLFHKMYKKYLPNFINGQYEKEQLKKIEYKIGIQFITKLIEQKLYREAIHWWFEIFKLKPKSKYHYLFWKQIVKRIVCLP